jgi:hypothetical protein
MLHAERGGEEQIADELRAYNPLLPQGNDLGRLIKLYQAAFRSSTRDRNFLSTFFYHSNNAIFSVATFMLEIPDPQKRTAELRRLGKPRSDCESAPRG